LVQQKFILLSLMLPPRSGCLSVFHMFDPCRGNRYVVPKRRKQATELRCTTSQKCEAVKNLSIHHRYLGTNSWICSYKLCSSEFNLNWRVSTKRHNSAQCQI